MSAVPYCMRWSSCRAPVVSLLEPRLHHRSGCTCSNTRGPYVSLLSAYDPNLSTWTAFFKLPEGGFRTVWQDQQMRSTSATDTSVHLRTVSPPLAGSWLCPSLVTLPALPQ